MTDTQSSRPFSSLALHLIAMAFMLCDHLWATVVPGSEWLTAVGRLAFPIFAFMLAQGFRHTHSFRRYLLRMFIFAVISEIPFDIMSGGTWFFPFHQNVMWTFFIALIAMRICSWALGLRHRVLGIAVVLATAAAGWFIGRITMVDYGGEGVLTVLLFYLLPGDDIWQRLLQCAALAVINCAMIGSLMYTVSIAGHTVELPEQGLAVLALIFIWLYNGRPGRSSRAVRLMCYAFYPVHALILGLLMLYR